MGEASAQQIPSTDVDTVAIRHHLDTLILKLAAAQAGSIDAVRESRRHAEAALDVLNRSGEALCEHARIAGVGQAGERWTCDGCGATWPMGLATSGGRPAPLRTQRRVHDPEPVAGRPDACELDEPVSSSREAT
jgi:hypothetical protein